MFNTMGQMVQMEEQKLFRLIWKLLLIKKTNNLNLVFIMYSYSFLIPIPYYCYQLKTNSINIFLWFKTVVRKRFTPVWNEKLISRKQYACQTNDFLCNLFKCFNLNKEPSLSNYKNESVFVQHKNQCMNVFLYYCRYLDICKQYDAARYRFIQAP